MEYTLLQCCRPCSLMLQVFVIAVLCIFGCKVLTSNSKGCLFIFHSIKLLKQKVWNPLTLIGNSKFLYTFNWFCTEHHLCFRAFFQGFYYHLTDTCPTGVRWSVTLIDRWQGAVVNISLSDEFHLTAVAEYAANELRCYLCRKQRTRT